MGNFIISGFPESVEIDGIQYPIRHDFKTGMKFEMVRDGDASDEEKLEEMLKLYYPKVPGNVKAAIDKMLWFYHCGKEESEEEDKRRYQGRESKEPAYCLEQDAPYVYAAFREQYGIDLTESSMHWWEFAALFESLGEDTKMWKIMYYRKVRLSGFSKDKRAFINEMKKMYRINRGGPGKRLSLEERNLRWKIHVQKRREM
jgi:hypothetical protein